MHIYKITNLVNGKVYVGQTVQKLERRWALHKHHSLSKNRPLYRAMRKHGVNNFKMEWLESLSGAGSLEALNERERFWIRKLDAMVPTGYNLTSGGAGKFFLAEETKARISAAKRGHEVSDETRSKISAALMGQISPRKGAVLSTETRAKISQVQIGRKASDETKEKMAASKRGAKAYNAKSVICIETGTEYTSTGEAARILGLQQSSISAVCLGKRKSTGGLRFKFVEK